MQLFLIKFKDNDRSPDFKTYFISIFFGLFSLANGISKINKPLSKPADSLDNSYLEDTFQAISKPAFLIERCKYLYSSLSSSFSLR